MKRLDDTIKELEYLRDDIRTKNIVGPGYNDVNLNPAINNLLALKEEIEKEASDSYSRGVEDGRESGYYDGYESGYASGSDRSE